MKKQPNKPFISDRRKSLKSNVADNRRRFIKRHRESIKEAAKAKAHVAGIGYLSGKVRVRLQGSKTREPTLKHDPATGRRYSLIYPADVPKGTKFPKAFFGMGNGPGSGDSEDDFEFELTADEFRDLYFEDLELPNFIKQSLLTTEVLQLKPHGTKIKGSPASLNLLESYKNAKMRRIVQTKTKRKAGKKKPAFFEDCDLRFDYWKEEARPARVAVMFCLMDVSGSMYDKQKEIAKAFYLLLYLFLQKCYAQVDVVFIRHTDEAAEVDEEVFFYATQSGGTLIAPGMYLIDSIIKERYAKQNVNFYIAQAGDGDTHRADARETAAYLQHTLLPQLQYMAYIEIPNEEWASPDGVSCLWEAYQTVKQPHFVMRNVMKLAQVYGVFRKLFEKQHG